MKDMSICARVMVAGIVTWEGVVEYRKGGEYGIVVEMGRPGVEISFRRRSKVCLRCMIFGVDGSGGGTVCSDVGGLGLVDGRCAQLSGRWMRFGWYVVFFGTLRFREVDVPRATPPRAVLPLFGTFVCDTVCGVMSLLGPTERVGAFEVGLFGVYVCAFGGRGRRCGGRDQISRTRAF